jgi:hypothetical protein
MKLSYRGAKYETELPTFDMMEGDIVGKYRGQAIRHRYPYPRHIPVPQPSLDLKYRGVAYRTNRTADLEEILNATPAQPRILAAPSLFCNASQSKLRQVAEIHRTNIYRNLERRMQVARELGDLHLVRLLELELQQIA